MLFGLGRCQHCALLVSVRIPTGIVIKLPLEMDESGTGSSLTWSGNSCPSQGTRGTSVILCEWLCTWGRPSCLHCPASPQVCLEGEISRQSILNSLSRGKKASGDLIPWTVSEQVMHSPCRIRVPEAGPVGGCVVLLSCWLVSPTVPRSRLRWPFRWKGRSHCCPPGLSRGNVSLCLPTLVCWHWLQLCCWLVRAGVLGLCMGSWSGASSSRHSSALGFAWG